MKQLQVPLACRDCESGRNCINGRWCTKLRRYVTHISAAPCEDIIINQTKQIMKAEEFFALVAKMRDKQREYFETRHKLALVEAKRLEHAVDNEIYRVKALLIQGGSE